MNRRDFFTIKSPAQRTPLPAIPVAAGGAQTSPRFLRRSNTGLEPYSGAWDYAHAAHLLRRIMVGGPTDAQIRQAVTDGLAATLDKVMTPFEPSIERIKDWAGKDIQFRVAGSPGDPEYDAFVQAQQTQREQLGKWWLETMATSPVSVQERLTLFWHNHFVSELDVVNFAGAMYWQNRLLRQSALGNFKKFVKDVTKDLAMLFYLDGIKNFKAGARDNINENYARELKELFTMGVSDWDGNPNYTETDVREAARGLTGWGATPSTDMGANYIELYSTFVPSRWDSGNKTFLGKTGTWNADDIVDLIFSERADQVSKFICEKLYRAFVYDVADRVVVEQMAETFRSSGWEIAPVVRQLLASTHFFDTTNIGALDKSPLDIMIGGIRQFALTVVPDFDPAINQRQSRDLSNRLIALGQQVFDPPNVKGWEGGRTWISTSTLPPRQKFFLDMIDGNIKGANRQVFYVFDPIAFARQFPDSDKLRELSDAMALYLLNTPPSAKESEMLYQTILDGGVYYEWSLDDPAQKPAERIKKHLKALVQLAKYQLY